MTRSITLPRALLVAGVALLVAPALFPVQPVLYHDTGPGTTANGSTLEAEGYRVVAYENLSARGQELYVGALRDGGEYYAPKGEGAPEFSYPTDAELAELDDYRARLVRQTIVVERPPNASLPPADEHVSAAEHLLANEREAEERRAERRAGTSGAGSGGSTAEEETATGATSTDERDTGPTVEEYRRQIARYDQMTTRTDLPPLFAPGSLLRLSSVLLGVVAIGTGGYLRSKP